MTRFIKNIILLAIAVVLVPLSVANRHTVSLSLNPFDPQDPRLTIVNIPLFWVIFASLGVGIIVGGLGSWAKQGRWRKEARVKRREADKWHKEADQLREQTESLTPGASSTAPKLSGPDSRHAA
ncbi:lipopolysaccharide assembly protein LapA domain-containing protein [Roseibium aggregatum]|uniref:lipopolysaccharide assembly protein LapA domain-containing protein n=1 Tax=Roseibium aggregatum TaxID=187304 RepID=UPI002E2D6F27|nr:lipopolysaccharide assembly protein LapA domain-containing protein [Roseibium aggregatum]